MLSVHYPDHLCGEAIFSLLAKMAGWTGLEPAAFRVTGGRYNQLNYHPAVILRATFIAILPARSNGFFTSFFEFKSRICQGFQQGSPFSRFSGHFNML